MSAQPASRSFQMRIVRSSEGGGGEEEGSGERDFPLGEGDSGSQITPTPPTDQDSGVSKI